MRCEVHRSQLQIISILNHSSVLYVKAVVAAFNQETNRDYEPSDGPF